MDYMNERCFPVLLEENLSVPGYLPPPHSSEDMKPESLTDVTAACILRGIFPEGVLKPLLPERSCLLLEPVLHWPWVSISSVNSPTGTLRAAGARWGQCRCRLASGLSKRVVCHLPPLHSLLSGSGRPHTAGSMLGTRWAWHGNPSECEGCLFSFAVACCM